MKTEGTGGRGTGYAPNSKAEAEAEGEGASHLITDANLEPRRGATDK
jgi:hypothetical protein